MASLIPTLNSCLPRMTGGERRFARRLESHLEDDYLCWYELPVGRRQRYSDFIVLHPARGLLLLEVKDWKLETIHTMDKVTATIATANGLKTVSNPLEQVRQCTYQLVNQLKKDPQLVAHDGRYRGNLVFPYAFGVVLSNITRNQFDATDLGEVLPVHRVICKDEMTEGVDPEAFQKRLWDMFDMQFPQPLGLPQIDRIRWHLFPEVRINGAGQGDLFPSDEADASSSSEPEIPDIVKVMDMQQELLARSLGEGHRVIHGVAGSGKTLILGYRCLHLAKLLHKPILVLCYNITLAARLREMIRERGVADRVHIYHFHAWCGEQLRSYHVPQPKPGEDYPQRLVQAVIDAVEQGRIPRAQYGAVMIDEGHDFQPDWLRLVVGMVDPDTNSLLLLYDDAQSIYNSRKTLGFSLSSVGIQAQGRTTILRLNYRNTDQILRFAYRFARHYLEPGGDDALVEPQSAGRPGPEPVTRLFGSYDAEADHIVDLFQRLHAKRGMAWSDLCVVYHSRWMGEQLYRCFRARGIPCQWLKDARARKAFSPSLDRVKLMTMHSSKGLEFPMVAVSGIGEMPANGADPSTEAKVLYVAMTRATEMLLLTSHRDNDFFFRLRAGAAPAEGRMAASA